MTRRSETLVKQVGLDPKVFGFFQDEAGFDLKDRAVFVCYVGSQAQGTHFVLDDTSLGIDDTDVLCVVVPPPAHVYGLHPWEGAVVRADPWDVKVLSISAFAQRLLAGDPVAIEPLWTRESEQFAVSDEFKGFLRARSNFLSRRYLDALSREANALESDMIEPVPTAAHYQGFLGERQWALAKRNQYDTRCAAHLLRRLKMMAELAEQSQFDLWRAEDGELLKAVKRGYFKLPEVQTMVERQYDRLADAWPTMILPNEAESEVVNDLLLRVLHSEWQRHSDHDQPHTPYKETPK